MKSKENAQIPKHVAIIPDGNRRWARSKNLIELKGHEKSAEKSNVISLIEEAFALKIDYVSIWGFSTENWKRKKIEVSFLFNLMMKVIR
ncbi:MAG: undecaprenyl diphosphate synthase family protein, partial [Nanoarchaeota archaeon]